jgi:hypothetical protein
VPSIPQSKAPSLPPTAPPLERIYEPAAPTDSAGGVALQKNMNVTTLRLYSLGLTRPPRMYFAELLLSVNKHEPSLLGPNPPGRS